MSSQFEKSYRVTPNSTLNADLWNSILQNIDQRILGIEDKKSSFEEAEKQLLEVGLRRINETIGPAAQKIFQMSQLGFLTASSAEMLKPVDGETLSVHLIKGDQADLFSPSPFIALVRRSTPDAYAIGKLLHYDRELARLDISIVSAQGDMGPHDDWDVAALAGSVKAMWDALNESRSNMLILSQHGTGQGQRRRRKPKLARCILILVKIQPLSWSKVAWGGLWRQLRLIMSTPRSRPMPSFSPSLAAMLQATSSAPAHNGDFSRSQFLTEIKLVEVWHWFRRRAGKRPQLPIWRMVALVLILQRQARWQDFGLTALPSSVRRSMQVMPFWIHQAIFKAVHGRHGTPMAGRQVPLMLVLR